jgi:HEAT repeat protein
MIRTLLLSLAVVQLAAGQTPAQDDAERARARALEDILRIQDTRSIHDGKLIRYLGDADRIVRARASLACGSIQDTSLIGLLIRNLDDPDEAVRLNAAFAIGQ